MNGVGWANSLPPSWSGKPLKAVADCLVSNVNKHVSDNEVPVRLCNYTNVYNNEFITLELDFMKATATEAQVAKFRLAVDDVMITKDSESWDDIGVPAVVKTTASDLVCGYHLALLRPRNDEIYGRFLFRCLQAKPVRIQLELAANGVTRVGLPKSEIGAVMIPVPPVRRQRTIVDYLDREVERIDRLIAAKEILLGILAEKRRALVTQAVTRGLDLNVPFRDSSIPWLGQIPANWETRKIAWLFQERDHRGEPDLPLLEVSINAGVILREFSRERIESTAADFNTYKVARCGDVVFNKMRMWQGAVGMASQDGLVSPDYVVASPVGPLSAHYAELLFRIDAFSAECARHSHGIVRDRLRLYWDGFRDIRVPLPSPEEQAAIVAHFDRNAAKLDGLKISTKLTIGLLTERRSALITAAVTGKIDVENLE